MTSAPRRTCGIRDTFTFERSATVLLLGAVAFAACFAPAQNDTWWHLRAGKETWQAGGVQLRDTFSHTAYGAFWPNQEWLGEVVLYGLYRVGGLPGATAAIAAIITATWALIGSLTPGPVLRRVLLLLAAVVASAREWSLRPKVFTLFFIALTLYLIARRRHFWLPAIVVLWANLHGGVMLGVVAIAAAAAHAAMVDKSVRHPLVTTAIACAIAPAATPLGFSLWTEIAHSLGRIRGLGIQEWQPPGLADPAFLPFWAIAVVFVALAVVQRAWRLEPEAAPTLWPACVLLPLAVTAGRNVAPALLAVVPALGVLIERRYPSPLRVDRDVPPLVNAAIVFVACGLAAAGVAYAWTAQVPRLGWQPLSSAAARAVAACPAPLYNRYDEGGFVIWFAPTQRVFLDGRQDPYPPDLIREQVRVEQSGDFEGLFRRHGINCAFLPTGTLVGARLQQAGWQQRYVDAKWVILARR